jgi:hypothetical protein
VYGSVTPTCGATTTTSLCLQQVTFNGGLDWSHEQCEGDLFNVGAAGTLALPPDWPHVAGPIVAQASVAACSKKLRTVSVGGSFTTTFGSHWAVGFSNLGYTHDFTNKTNSYTGTVVVSMPAGLSWGPFQQLPKQLVGSISGTYGGPMQLDAAFTPAFSLGLKQVNLQLERLHFTKASPWSGGIKATLRTSTSTHACDVTFDSTDTLTFAPPATDQVSIDISDSTKLTFTNFSVVLAKNGSSYTVKLLGTTTLDEGGTRLSGNAEIDVSTDGTFSGTLSHVTGVGLSPSQLDGFGIVLDSVSIDSAKNASGQRAVGASANASITFPNDWPGLAGQTFEGTVNVSSNGDFRIALDPKIDLGIHGFPIDVVIESLFIDSTSTPQGRSYAAGGSADIIVSRPINVLFGQTGSTTASFDATIEVDKDASGKKSILFSAKLPPAILKYPFSGSFATGELDINKIGLSTGPNVIADIDMYLDGFLGKTFTPPSPAIPALKGHAFALDFALNVQGKSISFDITATPDLKLDLVIFKLDLKEIKVAEVLEGMLGVGATLGFSLGIDFLFAVRAQIDNLVCRRAGPSSAFPSSRSRSIPRRSTCRGSTSR